MGNFEKLLSLPTGIQIQILSYLDLESQIAAVTVQLPSRFPELHLRTGFHNISAFLDNGRNNWYVKTTYFYIKSRKRALDFNEKSYLTIPDISEGKGISPSPLLNDLIFPPREFTFPQPPRTTITPSGEIKTHNPIERVKRKPLIPFFILFDRSVELPLQEYRYRHRLRDPGAIDWRGKSF